MPTPTKHNMIATQQVRRPKMKQTTTHAPAQTSPLHPPAATVTDLLRPPPTTAGQYDHVAAAAYLMKHAGTTALVVTDAQTAQPAGIITQADITRATAEGKDLNNVRVHAVMTTRPAITTTSSIRDAAKIMTARHYRHLPVTGDTGILGVIDITDVCQALSKLENPGQGTVADPDHVSRPRR
jgi:CBS domain-containing protein